MSSLRLGDCVESIYYNNENPTKESHRPFNNGHAQNPPLLRSKGVNRIILFPGSFNPPHQGHLDLLRHVFGNAREDLNIIAAIIIMTDDERLTAKLSGEEDALILTRDQRLNLWRGAGIPVDWAWIYDRPEASWEGFRSRLAKNLKNRDIELKFLLLGGPDNIGADRMPDPQSWGCSDVITSNISRPVDFVYPNSMRQLSGHTMWKQLDTTWVCNKLRRPKSMVAFVPFSAETKAPAPPSSTKIRNILSNSLLEGAEDQLKGVALHPDILVEYVRQRPKPLKPVVERKESPEETKEAPNETDGDFW
ncbi:hypothetical protein AK830_g3816 [Neonectria ditissima]|uniref:Cytidyltransferase-like domain-containing protein n=1 Tax=Neonectria ditissima TaxID=78410 RepID=A0A0P7AXJ3_9HYPO|nr:hypothetical protein AK830_g3816 [Neonectria ditissima]